MFSAFARINLAAAVLATAIVVFALSNGIGPFGPAFAGKETYFASIALFKLLTHFLFCVPFDCSLAIVLRVMRTVRSTAQA